MACIDSAEDSAGTPQCVGKSTSWPPLSAFHRLPREVFCDIVKFSQERIEVAWIEEAYQASDHSKVLPCWLRLMLVSREWRTTICNTPLLWQDFTVGCDQRWLRLALERSANTPLHIHVPPATAAENIQLVLQHASRIRELSFITYTEHWILQPLPSFPDAIFPSLKSLLLTDTKIELDPDRFPSLRVAYSNSDCRPWNSPIFSRLRKLCVSLGHIDLKDFVAMLELAAHSSHLEHLELVGVGGHHRRLDLEANDADHIIHFPHLTYLSVTSNSGRELALLLRFISHSPHVSIRIRAHVCVLERKDSHLLYLLHILPNRRDCLPMLRMSSEARIEALDYAAPENSRYVITCTSDAYPSARWSICFNVEAYYDEWTYTFDNLLRHFCTLFRSCPLRSLTITNEKLAFRQLASEWGFVEIFMAFPTITTLQLQYKESRDGSANFPIALWSLLPVAESEPKPECSVIIGSPDRSSAMSSQSILLPRMSTLIVDRLGWDKDVLASLHHCLQQRARLGCALGELRVTLSARTRSLQFDVDHERMLRALEEICGTVVYADCLPSFP